ncbi:protein FAM83G [Mugil cephalus]|uniref:protein FAM83G n=1 Tax=Mugil cephalus TaxID=48193 RepID=UPI001FB81F3B|nr:protein FAM83G [Mugil cephalus]XP_047435178.1 protein FAM83G [Mugil cephalus]
MALSQIQCLDDHHVNWRVSESKPEFFYSENQRLAIEALIAKGREAFTDFLAKHGVRDFLSEPELERIACTAEAYRPGYEPHQKPDTPGPGNGAPRFEEEAGDGEVSLEYWPDRSEASVAELDLGWPEAISYRGVTRVTVHTQPPTEGNTHIKEVVRKSIASAQKVIAVVMDVFTDVDIFRDLLDASYKRKIPVYIIIDMAAVQSFLSMCARADMHRGHLKNLRVRCCGGVEFFTRTAKKVRGSLSQRFLLVDGDRAISGSYSFTWSSSRLDRNLITVVTGQAVETFDVQFRDLYLVSRGVSLSKVPIADEPIREPLPQAAPAPVSSTVARKLINPKYALVAAGTHTSPTSSDQNSSNKNSNSQNPTGLKILKGRHKEVIKVPPLHPGLADLEKAYLIPYLPTWPEPDPPSDVIGFINIRDEKRANQVHLQRSERFEVSQAIRFSSPLTAPAKTPDQEATPEATHENPPGNTSLNTSAPISPAQKQVEVQATQNKAQSDKTDSPQQPNTTPAQDSNKPNAQTSPSASKVAADSQPTDNVGQTPEPAAPPVPKRRTLQLVIDAAPSEQPDQPQVTLIKMDQVESLDNSLSKDEDQEDLTEVHGRILVKDDSRDSGSNGGGSQDSTKVMCDRAADDNPSSTSTVSEEEFYDCSQAQPGDPLTNGVTTGSGRGHRQGDGVNMMARFSQSMLDLRDPSQSEDSAALIRESQQLRRGSSPHRHIGLLFQSSRSPGRDMRLRGPKVVIAKPGSFHRPTRASGPVIGGHRYWQGQMLHPNYAGSQELSANTRSGRSPRRHSPSYRKTSSPQPPPNPSGLLGVPLSKLSNFRNLKAKGGALQKKASQNNKADR